MNTDDDSPQESTLEPGSVDEVITSVGTGEVPATQFDDLLRGMGEVYRTDPDKAVRGQEFIKLLHHYVGDQLDARLTKFARDRGIKVVYEAKLLSATKPKNADVAVIDPENGPLVIIGVRSQMSSVGKNVLGYYEGIVGECSSLEEWFPMATHGYVYLHPLKPIKAGAEKESLDHARYARMYAAVTGRGQYEYRTQRGRFDEFAYLVVDFDEDPPVLRDDIVQGAVSGTDMRLETFVDRVVRRFQQRLLFWDVFA